jgi:hypothetical protein
MTTETNAASDAAAELPASELSQENPEVATPEPQAKPEDPLKALEEKLEKERKTFQRRIDRKHHDSAQAVAQARAEAQVLREQLQRLQPTDPPDPQGQQRNHPTPEDIERLATEKAEELAVIRETRARSNKVYEAGVKAFGEAFGPAVSAFQEDAGPLFHPNGKPTALGEAVLDSEAPEKLLHHLGQNPDLAESLRGLSAAQIGRRIARLEAEVTAEPRPSKAPPPIKPPSGSGGSGDPSPDSPDYLAYKLKQLRGR